MVLSSFNLFLTLLSALAFLFYGTLCLFSEKMIKEFERYQLARFRKLVGLLELSGGLGQLAGLYIQSLSAVSSVGLALLMICGIWARKRIHDPWYLWLPALTLFLINAYLFWSPFK